MTTRVVKRYSEAFRIQVVREYEAGASVTALKQKYAIKGAGTVQRWIDKYSSQGLRHRLMIIQSPEEQNQVKSLQSRIQQLEQLVAQLSLDKLMLESSLAVLEREAGLERKKNASPSSKKPTNAGTPLR